ncbi:MAG TPA: multicopper oxidase family protein [Aggregatilineales bacterium]|nr:multicopper oxidase family protein [Aggregatilineales bacterium]
MRRIKRIVTIGCASGAVLILLGSMVMYVAARRSILPDSINMSSSMDGMDMSGTDMSSMNMGTPGTPSPNATPMSALVQGPSVAPVKRFTLTTQTATIDLGNGNKVDAYTYNGSVPGPELRVQQGDLVEVTLVNKLPVSTTIHWHGMKVPNAEDGVAGLTQDAVKPGDSYTYRFVANDVGTYWYHSHQDTSAQLPRGLYGAIIVEPKNPPVHYDHDYTVVLHEWRTGGNCFSTCPEILSINNRADKIALDAKPGERVRLRIVAGGDEFHYPVLLGTPFKVIALDGHDLNGPTDLSNIQLQIGMAQRYDLSFIMPAQGAVTLIDAAPRAMPEKQHPMAVIGAGDANVSYPDNLPIFDFTSYAQTAPDTITPQSHFDGDYTMNLSEKFGFYNGGPTLTFPINGLTYPNIPTINVHEGDLVRIHFKNVGSIPHAMHLHGHYFSILTHNGQPLSGSPVHLDTLIILGGESYDIAFLAENPGLWMLHCHILAHDSQGMDMMVNYPNIYTPYTIGRASGNNPF